MTEKPAFVIACGPSLTIEDVNRVRGHGKVYAVKEAALMAPWADVLYAADTDWWTEHVERWRNFAGRKVTVSDRAAKVLFPGEIEYVEAKPEFKWSTQAGAVATGGNSGFQALNLAVLEGATRVVLMGFDYGYDAAAGESKHWWDDMHPRSSRYSNYREWNKRMEAAALLMTVPVLNATRRTAINCFPRVAIEDICGC